MNNMSYRGYTARVDVDTDDEILVGRVLGLRDVIGFHGRNVEELRQAFHEAVDNYLTACEQLGQAPERPASGRVMLRIPPELHASALIAAQAAGKSLNQWATDVLKKASRG